MQLGFFFWPFTPDLTRRMAAAAERSGWDMLGLFEYLSGRLAVWGTPEDCVRHALAAKAAGAQRLMFTVSLAADPVGTVELFGAEVLPTLRDSR